MSCVDAVAMSLCLAGEERLASLLVDNAVTKLSHLADAEHPRDWVGAAAIEEVELDFVWGLRSKARQRSRCVSFALRALRLVGGAAAHADAIDQTWCAALVYNSVVVVVVGGSPPASQPELLM